MQKHSQQDMHAHRLSSRRKTSSPHFAHFLHPLVFNFAKANSASPFRHAPKLFLVLFISFCFVLQENITKPLAETLNSDGISSVADALKGVGDSVGNHVSAIAENATQDLAKSEISAGELMDAALLDDDTFIWTGTTLLTIKKSFSVSELKQELDRHKDDNPSLNTLCFDGNITITTDQNDSSHPPFESAPDLESVIAEPNTHVSFIGASGASPDLQYFFKGCSKLQVIDGLSTWNVSNVKRMRQLFSGCSLLLSLDALTNWDVSSVTSTQEQCMTLMFNGCASLKSLGPLALWDVSHVGGAYALAYAFANCTSLTSLDGLSAWNVANLSGSQCMFHMFESCSSLETIEAIAPWNLGKAKRILYGVAAMFAGCPIKYVAGATEDAKGLVPTGDMSISKFSASNNWYPATGSSGPIPGNMLLSNWATYAGESSYWAVGNDSSPYDTSTQLEWEPEVLPKIYAYTGLYIPFNPKVTANSEPLIQGTDYRLSYRYSSGNEEEVAGGLKDSGTYIVSVIPQTVYTKAPANTFKIRVGDAYTVSFNLNDAPGDAPGDIMVIFDEAFPEDEKPEDPTWDAHIFDGWYTEEGDRIEWGTTLVPKQEDMTLYAHWTELPPTPQPIHPDPQTIYGHIAVQGEALPGETVHFQAVPDVGYVVEGLPVVTETAQLRKALGSEKDTNDTIDVISDGNNNYHFIMPNAPVFITATFTEEPTPGPAPGPSDGSDVGALPSTGDSAVALPTTPIPFFSLGVGLIGVAVVATYVARKRQTMRK